jgi:hypothetical protein
MVVGLFSSFIPRSAFINTAQGSPFPLLHPKFYTSAMSPIPIVICGRHPNIGKAAREGIKPEYDGMLRHYGGTSIFVGICD